MGRIWFPLAVALASWSAASGAADDAGEPARSGAEPGAGPTPVLGMERLLRLPDSFRVEEERRAGGSPSEWRSRFARAQQELGESQEALQGARADLEKVASGMSNWQMTAPGTDVGVSGNSPVSYRLLQEIRRLREEVERAEKRLDELVVEANLAGVPEHWRR